MAKDDGSALDDAARLVSTRGATRLAWIDALRVVDALLVVLVHVDYLARPDPFTWWPFGIYSILPYGLCVPVFFAIAGFVGAQSSAGALTQRTLRLVPLLFGHGVVLLLLGVDDSPSLGGKVVALASGVWYLYFVAALVQLMLAHAFVERFLSRHRAKIFVLALVTTAGTYALSSGLLWLRGSDLGALELRLRSFGTTWAAFYALGVALGRRPLPFEKIARQPAAMVLATALCVVPFVFEVLAEDARYGHASTMQSLLGGLPFQVVGTVTVMALGSRIDKAAACAFVARAAPATLSIYLLHGTVLLVAYRAWLRAGAFVHPLEVPGLALAAVVGALVIRIAASKLPRPLPWIVAGVPAKARE